MVLSNSLLPNVSVNDIPLIVLATVLHIDSTAPMDKVPHGTSEQQVEFFASFESFSIYSANGDIEPCAFIHYSDSNIYEKTLLEALKSAL